jgi:type IV secretory pathway VirB9-like protein
MTALMSIRLASLVVALIAAEHPKPAAVPPASRVPALPEASSEGHARLVTYDPDRIVTLRAKVHGLTIIRLPEHETIVDVTCPDKDLWIVNGHDRDVYVKPTVIGSHTDLGILTASDTLYAFALQEVTNVPGADRDFIVNVETSDAALSARTSTGASANTRAAPKFVPATQLEDYKHQLELARDEAKRAKDQAQSTIDQSIAGYRAAYPLSLHFGYRFPINEKPFFVRAIFDDGQFTYIQAAARELPALYELRDEEPALVQFDVHNGTYVVHKRLDRGYLAIGKQRLNFTRAKE